MGRHLVAAERALVEDDTDRAHEHTKVARRFAARIGVVREAAGIVAYRAGNFSEALSDLRAARRMTGSDAYLPIMADCERGMGRPERALDLVRSPEAERLDRAGRIELAIVESGARRDLGQHDAAVITLQRLPELRDTNARPWSARLAFAYADALAEAGHQDAATDWFAKAMAFDEDGETDAAERYAELTGAVIEDIEEDFEDADEDAEDVEGADEGTRGMQADDEEFGDVLDDEGDAQDGAAEARQPSDVLDDDDDEDEEPSAGDAPSADVSGSEVAASSLVDFDDEEELAEVDSDEEPVDEASDDIDDVDDADESDGDVEGTDDDSDDSDDDFDDLEEDLDGELADSTKGSTTSTEAKAAKAPATSGESEPAKAGIGPAFIEPNFGDILDDPEDSEDKK
ncbi:hypothetical protein [Nonomuraea recticatena]|uniref:Tetratricopeptide repeat protein n=1 Tax=Nonomuraea recticatena TaxID=46178 RepID=A0ABP6EU19_9ACTN